MKRSLWFCALAVMALTACTSSETGNPAPEQNGIVLRRDTVNVVKLTDTLLIPESTCRGCAYESSTSFGVADSLDMIKLVTVRTQDNNPPEMQGGNISKLLLLAPVKTGTTTIKVYKFWQRVPEPSAKDSTMFVPYTITVTN